MRTDEYAEGRAVDVFGEPETPTILLWHGRQTDARATVRVLAGLLAERGLSVIAPDWDSHHADGGRTDLLSSVRYAQSWSAGPEPLTLVGWSLGGVAAAGLTVHADDHDVALRHTVCLAGAFMARDPISGADIAARLDEAKPGGRVRTPFTLLHGTADDVVPPAASRTFAASLDSAGWPVPPQGAPVARVARAERIRSGIGTAVRVSRSTKTWTRWPCATASSRWVPAVPKIPMP